MPNRRTKNLRKKKKKSRKRKGGKLSYDDVLEESNKKQKNKQSVRDNAEKDFNEGPANIPINTHIPFHLGKKISQGEWQGDGYYHDTGGKKGYCYKSDGTDNPSQKKNKEKMTKFANVGNEDGQFCCGMGEVKAYDTEGKLIKKNGQVVMIPAAKIPNILTGNCDEPINFTNTLCSGGEVYVKQHNKALCCPLGQTPDIINGKCREDLTNKDPEVVAKRVKRIADATGVTRLASTAVKGATIVAAGGIGACFVFPPCAIVLTIAICIGMGMSAMKIKNFVQDKNKLNEIVDNSHELLSKLAEIQANVNDKYKKEDSIKASGLLARIRDCSKKLVKQPSDVGDEYMAQLVGKVPKMKKIFSKKGMIGKKITAYQKVIYDDHKGTRGAELENKTGLIVGSITACCNENGDPVECGKNTHVKVTYVPRPDNLTQTMTGTVGKNANNVRLIAAWDDTLEHGDKLKNLKAKETLKAAEYDELLKLSPATGKDKILDKSVLSSRAGKGFTKVLKQMFAGRNTVREYNNAMNEIKALIDEIDKTEGAAKEEIEKTREKVKAMFKKAVTKIKALSGLGAFGKKAKWKQEPLAERIAQKYPITFNQASDFDIACSKFAKQSPKPTSATGGKRRKSRKKRLRKSRRKSRNKRRKKSRHKRRKKSRRRRRR